MFRNTVILKYTKTYQTSILIRSNIKPFILIPFLSLMLITLSENYSSALSVSDKNNNLIFPGVGDEHDDDKGKSQSTTGDDKSNSNTDSKKSYSEESKTTEFAKKVKKDKHKSDDDNEENHDPSSYARLNFVAVGDWDCNSKAKKTIKNIEELDPELAIGLGDYSYSGSVGCWLKLVNPISDKLKITMGNHDAESSKKLKDLMKYFGLEKQYYSFNFENIHFISLSTEVPYDDDSNQYEFATYDLEKYSNDPNIDWIIVFFHRQSYGSGSSPENEEKFTEIYHPLFNEFGVNLVLQGHQHIYERMYPLSYNEEDDDKPYITDDSSNDYKNIDGAVFVTVGTGGSFATGLGSTSDYTAERFIKYGVLNVDIVNNGRTLKGEFYGNDGKIYDEFSIDK